MQSPMWRRHLRFWGPDPEADAREEVRFHIAATADELVARGWHRADAEREAERLFGDVRAIQAEGARLGRQRARTAQRKDYWGAYRQDVRYAVRTLGKERGFALITVLILALGIAANTAVFSVVNTVLLRPLPFPQAEQLVWLTAARKSAAEGRDVSGLSSVTYTVDAYEEYQRHNRAFQQVASYNPFFYDSDYTVVGRGEPQPAAGVLVSENFFQTLGVRTAHGRLFTHDECLRGGRPAVLLSYAYWQRHFNADPAVIGQVVTLRQRSSAVAATVVGVIDKSFDFGAVFAPGVRFDVFTPAVMDGLRNSGNTLSLVGRLKPGITVPQAQVEADIVWSQIHAAHRNWWGDYTSTLTGLKEHVSGKLRRALLLLWGAVGLMLAIVCVNLSNLMLGRGAARAKEFAVRAALGAGRARLMRQLITEGALLASTGAVLGLVLAEALLVYLARRGAIALPLLAQVHIDGAALAWTMGITVFVAVLFGVVPALMRPGANLQGSLKDSGPGTTAGRVAERLRSALVVSEVALASVLLVGAGLLLRSLLNVLDVDLGFQPNRAAVMRVDYDDQRNMDQRAAVLERLVQSVSAIPSVQVAGVTDTLPLGRNRSWGFVAKGKTYPRNMNTGALVHVVTPGYLAAMGMRIEEGRDFNWSDTAANQRVVVINRAAERYFWQGEHALGRTARTGQGEIQVVGVIADVHSLGVEETAGPEMYLPAMQSYPSGAELVVRSTLPPETLAPVVLRTLRALNPAQPAAELRPLQTVVDSAVSPRRFFAALVGAFATLGLMLAALGVYGVISYSVARRRQEIGIRMALGASAGRVRADVLGRAMRLTVVGLIVGAAAALVVAHFIEALLFRMKPADPLTFVGISALLAAVALAAGYLPARRASRIDPMIALRSGD